MLVVVRLFVRVRCWLVLRVVLRLVWLSWLRCVLRCRVRLSCCVLRWWYCVRRCVGCRICWLKNLFWFRWLKMCRLSLSWLR